MAPVASEHYVALAALVALLTAGCLLLARLFKLGFLADFLSQTVLVGFLTGVGFQVGIAVLGEMLGVPVDSRRTVEQLAQVASQFAGSACADAFASQRPSWRSSSSAAAFAPHARPAVRGRRSGGGERRIRLLRVMESPSSGRCGRLPRLALPDVSWGEVHWRLLPVAARAF